MYLRSIIITWGLFTAAPGCDEVAHTDGDYDGWTPAMGDCDDADPNTYPGAWEACDGADNDCNGDVDNAEYAYLPDCDGDGVVSAAQIRPFCDITWDPACAAEGLCRFDGPAEPPCRMHHICDPSVTGTDDDDYDPLVGASTAHAADWVDVVAYECRDYVWDAR